jgi:SAM-dependent methyltransferase
VLRRSFFGYLAPLSFGWCAADEEKIWGEYLEWYRRQPITASDVRKYYLEHLKRSGLSDEEIEVRSKIIERRSAENREELLPAFFDRTYGSAEPRFNTGPNALLVDVIRDLRPGRALDVHMGQGRNAIFLASKGWEVTGFDYSPVGIEAARKNAEKAGVSISAVVRRHEEFDFGRTQWDLIVMSYTWIPLNSPHIDRILTSLRPRGLLVFEHLMDESAGERKAPWLPRPNELLQVFGRLRILRYEDFLAKADWSWRTEKIARLVAEKP